MKHLSSISNSLPLYAEAPDFGDDTAAKNMYYMGQLLPPLMQIYTILQEVKSQYPDEASR